MRSFFVICAISLAVVSTGIAGTPVGNVISKDSISVNGITAPAGTYIPLEVGAEVSTRTASAFVKFADGTTVTLGPNSQLKVDGNVGSPEFHIMRGSAQYKLGPAARPRVTNGSTGGDSVATMASGRSSVQPPPAALVGSSNPATVIRPSSPVTTGGFVSSGASFQGFVTGASGGVLTSFTTPSGLTINLTPSVSANGTVSYTIASITQTATNSQGQTVTVTVTAFNGDSITVAPPSTPGTTTSTATISTPTGAPVTPTTVTTTVTTTASSQGATVPTPGVSTGSFSGTAN